MHVMSEKVILLSCDSILLVCIGSYTMNCMSALWSYIVYRTVLLCHDQVVGMKLYIIIIYYLADYW